MSTDFFDRYNESLIGLLKGYEWGCVYELAQSIQSAWRDGRQIFICGNGGSAANSVHLANDFIYGVSPEKKKGIKAVALVGNQSVITCIANDVSYDDIFSYQLSVIGEPGDILIALSGSGNSKNIINAVKKAKTMNIKTYAILGFTGGKTKELVDSAIHFPIQDMQISEDCQQIVGHMLMRWLKDHPVD